jgi:ribosomal protein S18 acetylase RimI-like enzyme
MDEEAVVFSIRPYREADFDALISLWRECGLIVPHNDPARDVAFCLASADAELFVVEDRGRLIAAVMTGHDGHRGWIYYLAVSPDAQGQGLGRRMMRHAETWLKDRGAPKVNLMIRDTNEKVRDFYRAIGYECEPRIVMARRLN